MVFGVAEVIAFVSQAITLEPGDLILTGTPAGVGAFRDPPVWLSPATRSRSRSTASARSRIRSRGLTVPVIEREGEARCRSFWSCG